MRSIEHQQHINSRISHNNCQECRADCERAGLRPQWTAYQFVGDYLRWAKPRLSAIKAGESSVNARIWHRDFIKTLHRRITLKGAAETSRKQNDSYRQRLGQFSRNPKDSHFANSVYLRRYAARGASTLNGY
jgi:hypothetical protein